MTGTLPMTEALHDTIRRLERATIAAEVQAPAGRVVFLDACRGVAVLGMLLANLVNVFLHEVPSPLAHNWGDHLRIFDLPAPIFQFLVGLSLTLYLQARVARGRSRLEARTDALRRFALLVLLGMVLDGVGTLSLTPHWGVLQTLGLGGAVATLLDGASDRLCALVAVALLAAFSGHENGVVHASPLAAFAFAPLTIAGLLTGRWLARDGSRAAFAKHALIAACGTLVAAELLFEAGVPFNKVLGTSSFVLLATATAIGLVAIGAELEAAGARAPAWLQAIGRDALTAWVLLHVLVYYPAWLGFPSWERLALAPGLAAAAAVMVALSAATIALGRRGLRVPL